MERAKVIREQMDALAPKVNLAINKADSTTVTRGDGPAFDKL